MNSDTLNELIKCLQEIAAQLQHANELKEIELLWMQQQMEQMEQIEQMEMSEQVDCTDGSKHYIS